MIKVNEIRIDNYLKAPLGEIMQVKQIGHKDNPNYIYCTYENGFGVNGFEPIPLTEEWLLKFGFEKHRFSHLKKHKSGVVLCLLDDCFVLNNYKDHLIINYKNKYVHQLQNLYFALTGQELELK